MAAMRHHKGREPEQPVAPADYTLREFAELLGHPKQWAYYQKNTRRVEVFKDNVGELRITAEEFDRFLGKLIDDAGTRLTPDLVTAQTMRRLIGGIGGDKRRARHGPDEIAKPMREGQIRAWDREIDPDGTLKSRHPAEYQRRLYKRQQAHMKMMSLEALRKRERGKAQERGKQQTEEQGEEDQEDQEEE